MIMDVGLGSDPMPDLIRVEKNGIRTTFVIEGKAESQLQAKDTEIESQLTKIYALNARVSHRGRENLNITRLARKSSETIEQLREEIDEMKEEVSILAEISAYDIGMFKRMKDELTALKDKIAEGIQVDIAYTGSTNIITNLPNALYGKFILLGLNEMEDDDG